MTDVARFYQDVIDDVINGVKDEWVEEGLDLQVLDELRKLWTNKLKESHVFDPEPSVNTAAQYLSLVQRSQTQIRPTLNSIVSNVPIRPMVPAGRMLVPNMVTGDNTRLTGLPGSLANVRSTTAQPIHGAAQQRMPQHNILPSTMVVTTGSTTTAQLQAQRGLQVTNPQLAALPSGLTGHLVQIGQQTYLVPQPIVGLRHQIGSSQVPISHLVGTTSGQNLISDQTTFQQTQVDGNHDNDDTHGAQRSISNASKNPLSNRPATVRSAHGSDFEDDDDDDDDDFVAATPGFNPASVRAHYPLHGPPTVDSSHHPDIPSLNSAPQTPMTPASVLSRTSFADTPGWRRPLPTQHTSGTAHAEKKRRRRASGAADTDTDYEEDEVEVDVYGDDADLATNASMTPADHELSYGDDEGDGTAGGRTPRSKLFTTTRTIKQDHSPTTTQAEDNPPDTNQSGSIPDQENLPGDEADEPQEEEEDPLNSEDDVSDEEPEVLFESDNVVVCQYDKIHRCRNRWRFHLKDGIMAIHGRDHVFQKAVGEAEW